MRTSSALYYRNTPDFPVVQNFRQNSRFLVSHGLQPDAALDSKTMSRRLHDMTDKRKKHKQTGFRSLHLVADT